MNARILGAAIRSIPGVLPMLVPGALMAVTLTLLAAMVVLGAEPSVTPAAIVEGGDPRSEGAGPGLVGAPLLILAGVIALGIATAVLTVIAARLARRA